VSYESSIPFRSHRVPAAAVYCSDGRFGEQFDEFLHQILGPVLFDRLAVPGGPASLGLGSPVPEESRGIEAQLEFLVRAHDLEQVILIAHVPCAFYRERLQVPDDAQPDRQVADLREAARVVRALGSLRVDAWAARVVDERVQFHPMKV
jgi:hypothetical protein